MAQGKVVCEWIRKGMLDLVKWRKNTKENIMKVQCLEENKLRAIEYKKLTKDVRRNTRYKRKWVGKIVNLIKRAAALNNMQELYNYTRIMARRKLKINSE